MIPDPDALGAPGEGTPADLLGWRPPHGVLSLYVRVDPADRTAGWHTEIRNGLSDAVAGEGAASHETRSALEATAKRLRRELAEEPPRGEPRALIGFVEVAQKQGEERWYAAGISPRRTEKSTP